MCAQSAPYNSEHRHERIFFARHGPSRQHPHHREIIQSSEIFMFVGNEQKPHIYSQQNEKWKCARGHCVWVCVWQRESERNRNLGWISSAVWMLMLNGSLIKPRGCSFTYISAPLFIVHNYSHSLSLSPPASPFAIIHSSSTLHEIRLSRISEFALLLGVPHFALADVCVMRTDGQ